MRKKKRREPEYRLNVFHHREERTRRERVVFYVQTIKVFTNFNYEILLKPTVSERKLDLRIEGLRTTPLIMPGVGPARGWKEFEDIRGPISVNVIKLDGEGNEFLFDISPTSITVLQTPDHPFILVSTEPVRLPEP